MRLNEVISNVPKYLLIFVAFNMQDRKLKLKHCKKRKISFFGNTKIKMSHSFLNREIAHIISKVTRL